MSKKYYLHRISHQEEVAVPLLADQNILSIGWSDFSTPDFIECCTGKRDELEKRFEKGGYGKPRNRYCLSRFLEMKKGDFIVVPPWSKFSIYKIVDDRAMSIEELDIQIKAWGDRSIIKGDDGYLHYADDQNRIDLGFFRKVEPIIEWASRHDFADGRLTARMKVQQTNVEITNIHESVEKAIDSFKKNKPINLHSLILKKNVTETLSTIMEALNPNKLEKLVQWYLERVGATDVFISSKNESNKEGDADVIATFEHIKTIIYVQVKFHQGDTSEYALEQIKAYKENKEEANDDEYSKIAWVVSTGNFTEDCCKQAIDNKIQLIDGEKFTKMLLEAGISTLEKVFS